MGQATQRAWRRAGAMATLGMSGLAAAAPSMPDPAASSPALVVLASPAPEVAGDTSTSTGPDATRRPLALQASLAALRARMQPWHASGTNTGSGTMLHQGLAIQVIELPREGAPIGPPPKRVHHALSIGMEGPKQMLRGLGLDATECAGRFRMPSKLNRKGDGSTQVDVSAQLGMACKF
ncbi:hypothetical protein [Roseateles chitinivorans]|nr:hypothetical protein [Roseateles chitinivorans]